MEGQDESVTESPTVQEVLNSNQKDTQKACSQFDGEVIWEFD